ncbi:hypothetical protein A3725_28630 [Alcanivorax sp. HI0035]|nr:hypothetical protein A3725_28630 [Alcanivorax sp. HI0035]
MAPFGQDNEWNWEVAVYYAQIEDEILSVEKPGAPGTSQVTNVEDTIHAGVEALFCSVRPSPWETASIVSSHC